ncbi:cupin domain-containing protein [Mycobacterium sp. URHB0021]
MRVFIAPAAAMLSFVVAPVGAAGATPAEGEIVRTEIAKGTTDVPIAIVAVGQETTFYVQNLVLKPAASSGWHTHAGPEYTVINDGTVDIQQASGCVPVAYTAGQAVFIQAGVPHAVSNRGPGTAEAVVTYTLPAEHAVRDDAASACP